MMRGQGPRSGLDATRFLRSITSKDRLRAKKTRHVTPPSKIARWDTRVRADLNAAAATSTRDSNEASRRHHDDNNEHQNCEMSITLRSHYRDRAAGTKFVPFALETYGVLSDRSDRFWSSVPR